MISGHATLGSRGRRQGEHLAFLGYGAPGCHVSRVRSVRDSIAGIAARVPRASGTVLLGTPPYSSVLLRTPPYPAIPGKSAHAVAVDLEIGSSLCATDHASLKLKSAVTAKRAKKGN